MVHDLFPPRHCGHLFTIRVDGRPVVHTASSIDIYICDFQEAFALPEIADSPETENDRETEIRLEKLLGGSDTADADWGEGRVELGDQADGDETEADPGAGNAKNCFEWKLVECVTLMSPCTTEADV